MAGAKPAHAQDCDGGAPATLVPTPPAAVAPYAQASSVPLKLARVLQAVGRAGPANIAFAAFALAFFLSRIVLYPTIIVYPSIHQ